MYVTLQHFNNTLLNIILNVFQYGLCAPSPQGAYQTLATAGDNDCGGSCKCYLPGLPTATPPAGG